MKAIAFRSKKQKGKRLEARVAQLIREKGLDGNATRMPGSGAFYGFKTDLHTKLPYSFEMKNQERLQIWKAWQQAIDQATIAKPAILCISGNFRPILAIMDVNTFLNLLLEIQDLQKRLEQKQTPS